MNLHIPMIAGALAILTSTAVADTFRVPTDRGSIQEAIDACQNGDEVLVADGTWTGADNRNLDFDGRLITVRSESGNREDCVIDCQNAGRAFYFHSGETPAAKVMDLTITRGRIAYGRGGGIACVNSHPIIENCFFNANSVTSDAVATGGGALVLDNSDSLVTGCLFKNNTAFTGGHITGFGGALSVLNFADATVTNCVFEQNTVTAGGPFFHGFGGAVSCSANSRTAFTGCTFRDNSAYMTAGAMYVGSSADVTLTNCLFEDNTCDGSGGALVADGSSGGLGVVVDVEWCTFDNNDGTGTLSSQAGIGGGAIANTGATLNVSHCTLTDNSSTVGAGISTTLSGDSDIINCLLVRNDATDAAAVNCALGSTVDLRCSTVTENTALTTSGSVSSFGSGSSLTVRNSIVYDNTAPGNVQVSALSGGTLGVDYTDVEGGWAGTGNLNVDPQFLDSANGNYRPAAGSPVIDAGSNAWVPAGLVTDLDDRDRIVDGDADTVDTVDMGAYELQLDCPGDTNGDGLINVDDLNNVILDWGTDGSANGGDLTDQTGTGPGDGVVDVNDLNAVIVNWGLCG